MCPACLLRIDFRLLLSGCSWLFHLCFVCLMLMFSYVSCLHAAGVFLTLFMSACCWLLHAFHVCLLLSSSYFSCMCPFCLLFIVVQVSYACMALGFVIYVMVACCCVCAWCVSMAAVHVLICVPVCMLLRF